MTLHWWMHWFWVTVIHLAVILANPLPSTTQEPQVRISNQELISRAVPESSSINSEDIYLTDESIRHNFRVAKAIGVYPDELNVTNVSGGRSSNFQHSVSEVSLENATRTNIITKNSPNVNVKGANISANSSSGAVSGVPIESNITSNNNDRTSNRAPGAKKDSKVTWILTTNKTSKSKIDEKSSKGFRNLSIDENEDLAVLPLQEEGPRFKLVMNRTKPISSSDVNMRTFNKSDDVVIDEELAERQILATAATVLQGVSESTRLSRARNTFTSDFHRNQEQENDLVDNGNGSSNDDGNSSNVGTTSAVDIAAITGSCLATVLLLSTMGSLGFIMYRRRYLNPPQTLNSDKCSNPDSSGYIDDSTIRDNSEEMYSLDNDSFLNSLEAMTIQNYWTDSVKHTKL